MTDQNKLKAKLWLTFNDEMREATDGSISGVFHNVIKRTPHQFWERELVKTIQPDPIFASSVKAYHLAKCSVQLYLHPSALRPLYERLTNVYRNVRSFVGVDYGAMHPLSREIDWDFWAVVEGYQYPWAISHNLQYLYDPKDIESIAYFDDFDWIVGADD